MSRDGSRDEAHIDRVQATAYAISAACEGTPAAHLVETIQALAIVLGASIGAATEDSVGRSGHTHEQNVAALVRMAATIVMQTATSCHRDAADGDAR